ncbi:hypothetical protein K490DRAFT_57421 [Saccharata proteae CBS 121410]|uniref:Uncharacterized protein n=1 Tax=Saccharata proteae CBS 121410 TaxID=1314787 RepID=A0A9P4LUY0_9PEZI|nr:hypothetical protein K490DRAFT_57421 [Saccharata proteae CBS 121410]
MKKLLFSVSRDSQCILGGQAFQTNRENLDKFIEGIEEAEPPRYLTVRDRTKGHPVPLLFVKPRPDACIFDAGKVRLDSNRVFRARVTIQETKVVVQTSPYPYVAGETLSKICFETLRDAFAQFHEALRNRCSEINEARLAAWSLAVEDQQGLIWGSAGSNHLTDTDETTEGGSSGPQSTAEQSAPSLDSPARRVTAQSSSAQSSSVTNTAGVSIEDRAPLKRASDAATSPNKRARRDELGAEIYDAVAPLFAKEAKDAANKAAEEAAEEATREATREATKEAAKEASNRYEQIRQPAANLLKCLNTGASFKLVMEAADGLKEALAVDEEERSNAKTSKINATNDTNLLVPSQEQQRCADTT